MKRELITGGRGYGKTVTSKYIYDLEQENKRQKKVIDRLSRKIQRLTRISFKKNEITLILYCIDMIIQNYGENRELEKIYNRLYLQRKEHISNAKKSF